MQSYPPDIHYGKDSQSSEAIIRGWGCWQSNISFILSHLKLLVQFPIVLLYIFQNFHMRFLVSKIALNIFLEANSGFVSGSLDFQLLGVPGMNFQNSTNSSKTSPGTLLHQSLNPPLIEYGDNITSSQTSLVFLPSALLRAGSVNIYHSVITYWFVSHKNK